MLTYLVRHILSGGLLEHASGLVGDLLVGAALLRWVNLATTELLLGSINTYELQLGSNQTAEK